MIDYKRHYETMLTLQFQLLRKIDKGADAESAFIAQYGANCAVVRWVEGKMAQQAAKGLKSPVMRDLVGKL